MFSGGPRKAILVLWFLFAAGLSIILSGVLFGALVLIWSASHLSGEITNPLVRWAAVRGVIAFVILLPLTCTYQFFLWGTYKYLVTNQRIIYGAGIMRRVRISIPFHKVTDVTVDQNIVQRVLGIASFHIQTAGAGYTEIVFIGLGREETKEAEGVVNRELRRQATSEDRRVRSE